MKKVKYQVRYGYIGDRLFVDAWDIYNQLVSVLPENNGKELWESFMSAEKKLAK